MTTNTVMTLSTIRPDWDDLTVQLGNALAQKQSWSPLLNTQTASILIEAIAAMGTFLQAGIGNSLEESYPQTARMPSSLKAAASFLGVRLGRKAPAKTTVVFTRTGDLSVSLLIPEFSAFTAPGSALFNRSAIAFERGQATVTADLHEGFITQVQYRGQGLDSQQIVVKVPGFTISDQDVRVALNSEPVQVVTDGIWHYPITSEGNPNYVVQDGTLPTGELKLEFGNTQFGVVPPNGSSILVSYAVTNGLRGNNSQFAGQKVSAVGISNVNGVATTSLDNGTNEPDAEMYRDSPLVFASYERAVAIPDHPAIATMYPGVVDAIFLGQKDIAPDLKEWMNVVYCYILMTSGEQMTGAQFTDFKDWWSKRSMPLEYVLQVAHEIRLDVRATIYITGQGDPTTARAKAQAAVQTLFTARQGYLGRNLYLDDLIDVLRNSDPYIDHVVLNTPTEDQICKVSAPAAPAVVPGTVAGTLTPGTYVYAISAVTPARGSQGEGETFASANGALTTTNPSSSATIRWTTVAGAVRYRIYGRTTTGMGLLAEVPATTLEWTDTGSVTPGAPLNQINTVGISYTTLNTLNISVAFTDRVGS